MTIGIINYGVGNIHGIKNMFRRIAIDAELVEAPNSIFDYSHIILPGVGSFDHAIQNLHTKGFFEKLLCLKSTNIKLLGVCLGMQMLLESSEEGQMEGLGLIPGKVKKFDHNFTMGKPIPQMNWNTIAPIKPSGSFSNLNNSSYYFANSYIASNIESEHQLFVTTYGSQFTSGVQSDNVLGVQFHPEKSHFNGMRFLRAFAAL
jgi:glutamine amidotransferase